MPGTVDIEEEIAAGVRRAAANVVGPIDHHSGFQRVLDWDERIELLAAGQAIGSRCVHVQANVRHVRQAGVKVPVVCHCESLSWKPSVGDHVAELPCGPHCPA